MFCRVRLEDLEKKWQDTSHEDSINCSIGHINHVLRNTEQEWMRSILSNKEENELDQTLAEMNEKFRQACEIEKITRLGIPEIRATKWENASF